MRILADVLIVLATVIAMEAVAFLTHKYIMHGLGWGWHRSHHEPHEGTFEKNDLYAVVFAVLAFAMLAFASPLAGAIYWIGVGMALYGVLYFVFHDGLVHGRWPFRMNVRHPYLKRLVQAHRLHHAVEGRDGGVSFGFLYAAPVRKLRDELREKNPTLRGDAG